MSRTIRRKNASKKEVQKYIDFWLWYKPGHSEAFLKARYHSNKMEGNNSWRTKLLRRNSAKRHRFQADQQLKVEIEKGNWDFIPMDAKAYIDPWIYD